MRPQNGLVFLGKETHSETKSWKSSRISTKKVRTTTVNPGNCRGFCVRSQISSFFHCSSFFVIFSLISFILSFFLFLLSSCFFIFFHFLSSSFIFCNLLSCSFFFFFCFVFFFVFLDYCCFFLSEAQNLFFASISLRFLFTFLTINSNFKPVLGGIPEALFSCFPPIFFLLFFFLFLGSCSSFLFLFFLLFLKSFSLFVFLFQHLYQGLTKDGSSVVGAPGDVVS